LQAIASALRNTLLTTAGREDLLRLTAKALTDSVPRAEARRMRLTVNGDDLVVDGPLTVRGLLEHLQLTTGPVAVERNRQIVPRAAHLSEMLAEGDEIEVVHFVGGG
jgi:sulfur carrier protein